MTENYFCFNTTPHSFNFTVIICCKLLLWLLHAILIIISWIIYLDLAATSAMTSSAAPEGLAWYQWCSPVYALAFCVSIHFRTRGHCLKKNTPSTPNIMRWAFLLHGGKINMFLELNCSTSTNYGMSWQIQYMNHLDIIRLKERQNIFLVWLIFC